MSFFSATIPFTPLLDSRTINTVQNANYMLSRSLSEKYHCLGDMCIHNNLHKGWFIGPPPPSGIFKASLKEILMHIYDVTFLLQESKTQT